MKLERLALALCLSSLAGTVFGQQNPVDQETASRLAGLALTCVHQEYPNKISHVMGSDADVHPPRELTPAFYGCFDWHSSVHGHWLLARLARQFPEGEFQANARAALAQSLTAENLLREATYFEPDSRRSYERPYGIAWLLQLGTELREWDDPDAREWLKSMQPLETLLQARLTEWLGKLSYPIRTGEHSQTAFAFGLFLDWAKRSGQNEFGALLEQTIRRLYLADRNCPLNYEPSGQDFLSPCLAEADLLRRILPAEEYGRWLNEFLPGVPRNGKGDWLEVSVVTDKTDGKLAHLDGLNLSRAWMLEGIAAGLPGNDPRIPAILAAAAAQSTAGLAAVTGEHYAGGHWLGSFATYLVTRRGIKD